MIPADRPSRWSIDNTLALLADCAEAGRLAGDIERLKGSASTLLPALKQEHDAAMARIVKAAGKPKATRRS